jgi:ATP adenylyltransferase
MENLWAPWRMEYITGKREEGCVFCKVASTPARLAENLILHVGQLAFVILNKFPYHSCHLMVIPLRHTSEFTGLTAEENAEMSRLLQLSTKALKQTYHPEGFNIGMNLGQCAGAGIREHLHYHVVPRWVGDTNFFPLLAHTRSMPELLGQTYDRLRPSFRQFEERGEIVAGGHRETEGTS